MNDNEKVRIKQPKTYDEQIEIFKDRNLAIEDEEFAKKILSQINYYRFSAYTLSLKDKDQFHEGVTFNDIYRLYEFDRRLRLLILAKLEIIEISFRTKIAYYLAHKYGPTGYLDKENFDNLTYFEDMNRQIKNEIKRSKEMFVSHHKSKYESVFPVWVAIEVTSFSLLSKIYSNLKNTDQTKIANLYSNNRVYIKNWLYALSTIRNICAHFGRLYNRQLPIHFKLLKRDRETGIHGNTIFGALFVMGKVASDSQLWSSFIAELRSLIDEYNEIELKRLGFPENWEKTLREI